MQSEFSDLLDVVIKHLEQSKLSPKDIVNALGPHIPDECQTASNLDDFFGRMLPDMTFFNYEIPSMIIKLVGGEVVKELKKYEALFESYCKNRVSGPHPIEFTDESRQNTQIQQEKMLVKLDMEWEEMPLHYVKSFQYSLASILKIREETLIVHSVREGCVLFTFLIRSSLLQTIIIDGINEEQKDALRHSRVVSIEATSVKIFEDLELV